jgi:hypothetical protein
LFIGLVWQQTEMALMLMGKVPHPESGATVREFDRARMLIDQLEALEVKTRGNLTKAEAEFLKQSLMTLRMAYVEGVGASPAEPSADNEGTKAAKETTPDSEDESRKRFTKKY